MKTYLIRGALRLRNDYIEHFKKTNSIASYNIISYEEKLTIKDVRDLKKRISYALENGVFRVVIFPLEITLDAQNALLKTLEEPPLQTYFILQEEPGISRIIPTIVSRSFVVLLGADDEKQQGEGLSNDLQVLFDPGVDIDRKMRHIFMLSEKIETQHDLESLMFALHLLIHSHADNIDIHTASTFLTVLFEYYDLGESNNVSKRGIVENALLTTFS